VNFGPEQLGLSLGPHTGFIVAAYLVTAAVVAALVTWVIADHAAQKRALADLERRGVTRRSTETRPMQIKEPA
jgi:heme exporter protein D